MSALEVFTYTDQQVRTIVIDSDPWFIAADVAAALGYRNGPDMTRRLDPEDLGTTRLPRSTSGGNPNVTIINESGLYDAILGSQLPSARDFKRWVTREVLPAIRKTGSYSTAVPMTYPEALRAAADAAERATELEALRAIEAPKAEAYDDFLNADGSYGMEAAAKSLSDVTGGMGRTRLFAWLRAERVLMSNNSPYQEYAHWFKVIAGSYEDSHGVTRPTKTTYVRPVGLDGIRRKFTRGN